MNSFWQWMGGRTTAFALVYMICGIVLAFLGKLTPVYITLGTPVLAMLGKSIHDDYHQRKMAEAGKVEQKP